MSDNIKDRLASFRKEMSKRGIDYYIVPTDDYHISEYVGDYFKCREYLSGFTGSAGILVVGMNEAKLWTDGRYFIQAAEELNGTTVELMKMGEKGVPTIYEFLNMCGKDLRIGYDGKTMSYSFSINLKNTLKNNNITYVTDEDLVDVIWNDRPKMSAEPIWILDTKYAGKSVDSKLTELRENIVKEGAQAILLTALDEVAWLYNYRGNDILYTPVALAYSIVTIDKAALYINKECLKDEVKNYFEAKGILLRDYFDVYKDIKAFNGMVLVDPDSTNELLCESVNNPKLVMSPVAKSKAIKNEIEIANEKKAHLKDGIALTKEIYRIKKLAKEGRIHNETELSLERDLTGLRKEQENFVSLSFESIVATSDHAPICHYEPTEETDKHIEDGFLLIDTGGHYLEGSTDVTRTISIGEISRQMKLHYTAVLKGHIDLALAKFPKGTLGNSLDCLARKPIWDLGLDFNHGTGHGVGYLLGVHEGPNSIRRQGPNAPLSSPLYEGMITSDEPGIYIEGQYGIRIENLFLTTKVNENMDDDFLTFEMLTLAPYDKDSINFFDLSEEELSYLRKYNERLVNELGPYLDEEELSWLKEETEF